MKFMKGSYVGPIRKFMATIIIGLTIIHNIEYPTVYGLYLNNGNGHDNGVSRSIVKRSLSQMSSQQWLLALCGIISSRSSQTSGELQNFCTLSQRHISASSESPCISVPIPKKVYSNTQDAQLTLTERLSQGILEMKMKQKSADLDWEDGRAIFILGNKGSGKTTLMQILNGNLSELYATKKTANGEMIILDYEGLITPPIAENTNVIPNFKLNPENGDAFWDCPSFYENRSIEMDILANYFVKRALDQVSEAKFLFTIPHKSLTDDDDSVDFHRLVTYATNLIKNPEAHAHSIGLIVTKVAGNNSLTEENDDVIVLERVNQFLKKYVESLTDKITTSEDSSKKLSLGRALQFTKNFLNGTGDDSQPSQRISLVRTPSQCGTLVDMIMFSRVRKMITDLYSKHLKYSVVSPEDFDVSVQNNQTVDRISAEYLPETMKTIERTLEKSANASLNQLLEKFYNLDDPSLLLGSKRTRTKCFTSSMNENLYQLMVIGENIKFSQLFNSTNDSLESLSSPTFEWPLPCSKANVKEIVVMARNKVTIDYDLNGDCEQLHVAILAPNWEIIGDERRIQLGCSITPSEYSEDTAAADVGKDGQAGFTGRDSGSFFGIFSHVTNGNSLYINADGGKGGSGQNGGQGYEGQPGEDVVVGRFPGPYSVLIVEDIHRGHASENGSLYSSLEDNILHSRKYADKAWYTLYSEKGKQGGAGGKGGSGGLAGHPGLILLVSTSQQQINTINISMQAENGKPGKGGVGGLGGIRGRHLSCQAKIATWHLSWLSCFSDSFNLTRAESGEMGPDGTPPSFSRAPNGLFSNKSENWRIVSEYKQAFSRSILQPKFIYELDHNPDIANFIAIPSIEEEMEYMQHNGVWRTQSGARKQKRESLVFLEDLQQKSDIQLEALTRNTSISSMLVELSNDIGLSMDDEDCHINSLTELEMQLYFFETVTGKNQSVRHVSYSWLTPLKNLSKETKNIEEFYELCEDLEVELGSYTNQVLLGELQRNGSLNLEDSNTMLEFLKTNKLLPISYKNVTLREDRKAGKYLSTLVKRYTPKINVICEHSSLDKEKYQLVVSGRNVKFSDFLNSVQSTPWPYPCSKETVKDISIMAQVKVFIDYDLDGNCKELQVSIVAPKWEIIESDRKILLGCTKVTGFAQNAGAGVDFGDRGKNGARGKKGTDAGSFFGIFSHLENGKALSINADGGKGGSGENGGKGQIGRFGESAAKDKYPSAYSSSRDGLHTGYLDEFGMLIDKSIVTGFYNHRWYTLYGDYGKEGGQGGNGGDGGLPGHPGNIVLISSSSSDHSFNNIQTSTKGGQGGTPGAGGFGGKYGQRGDHMSCTHADMWYTGAFWWAGCYTTVSTPTVQYGKNGANGTTPIYDKSSRPSSKFESWRIINKYKRTYFEASTKKPSFMNELDYNKEIASLMTPLSFAEEIEAVEQSYWRTGSRGRNSQKKGEGKFFIFYEDFLARLRNYAEQKMEIKNSTRSSTINSNSGLLRKPIIMTTDERIALNYIYAAALSKMIGMRRNMNTLNVINTKDYFDAISRQLVLLRQSEKENAIAEESLRYKEKMDKKANEAMNFIIGTVQPALDSAEKVLDEQNDKLFREINEYLSKAEDDLERQKKLKRDFQNSLPLRNLMAGLKVVGAVCQFCGPWGQVAGTVISGATSIAEPFLLDAYPSQKKSNIPFDKVSNDFLKTMKDRSDKYYDRKMGNIQEQIDKAKEAFEKEGIDLQSEGTMAGDKMETVTRAIEELKQAKSTEESSDAVNLIARELNLDRATRALEEFAEGTSDEEETSSSSGGNEQTTLDVTTNEPPTSTDSSTTTTTPLSEEDKLKLKLKKKKEDKLKAKKIISILGKSMKAIGTGVDLWQGVNQQNNELARLDKLVKDADKTVKEREVFKETLYDEFLPKLATVTDDIKNERENLLGQSTAGLSVKKWKLKGMMKNMKKTMEGFTKEMKVAEEFQNCVDQLDEAMTLLIDLYDQIEQYEEKKQLADYIANVNLASDAKSKIENEELKKAIARMEFSLHANLFVEDYYKAMGAFKQWVFPFAANYLIQDDNVDLTSLMNITTTKDSALDEALGIYKRKVDTISMQIEEYHATTVAGDENIIATHFSGDFVSRHPFYVWSNDKWRGSIKRLLSGKEVLLKADMDKDPKTVRMLRGKSAVKFKSIEVHFRMRNQSLQSDLNESLKHFEMIMTHSGISTYGMMGQKYVMFDSNQTYRFSFERKDGAALTVNTVTRKAQKHGDFLMSPYTWWTFQLIDVTHDRGVSFKDLSENFGDKVDLELVGDGIYLDELRANLGKLDKLNMEFFYEAFDSSHEEQFERKAAKVSGAALC